MVNKHRCAEIEAAFWAYSDFFKEFFRYGEHRMTMRVEQSKLDHLASCGVVPSLLTPYGSIDFIAEETTDGD